MAYACCMLLLMLHSTINELLVLHKILLLTVKSSLGNQSREEHLTWKKVGLLRIFLFGLVFFFFKKCMFLLIVWNEEGEITALAMVHSSSTSFLYWHFTLEAAFIPLSHHFEGRPESLHKNLCFFSGLLEESAILGQWLSEHFFFVPSVKILFIN